MKAIYGKAGLVFILLTLTHLSFSQKADSTRTLGQLAGGVTVTNNGISLLPTFALGKPAVMFDLSVGTRKLRFEPQFRFSLEGKPWSFLFWWRSNVVNTRKFQLNIGAHPAIAFKTVLPTNEATDEITVSKRFLAGEIAPNYSLTKNTSVGVYYLHSHGFDTGVTKTTHFLALRSFFSNIRLSEQFFMNVTPQVYYLKLDENDGVYFTSTLTVAKQGFPLTVQSIINKTIQSTIPASKDLVWNVSLIYSFNKKYRGV